ncbi:MAG: hypothetical protein JO101_02775 [Candidatus Eremiobacteraeota bacterium]|nr:hypothetical protein [Candidatus Eremiobacteraeota bacterium]
MTLRLVLFLSLLAAAVAGCGGGGSGSGTSGVTPIPTSSNRSGLEVLTLGDDLVVGIGTSSCGVTLPSSACPSNAANPGSLQSVAPNGWSQLFGSSLNLPRYQPLGFVALGVTGALSGDAPLKEGVTGDLIVNPGQFPALSQLISSARSRNIKLLIVFESGINDVLDAFYSDQCRATGGSPSGGGSASLAAPCTASNTSLADTAGNVRNGSYYHGYLSLLANLVNLAGGPPEGTLIVGVPDVGSIPFFAGQTSATQRAALTADSQLANSALRAAIADSGLHNVTFADWFAYNQQNPQNYTSSYYAADFFHLSDLGHRTLASFVESVFPGV